jgi:hypothetical protein
MTSLDLFNWVPLGIATEVTPGDYSFIDVNGNNQCQLYSVIPLP